MTTTIESNTQAILLLTAPLLASARRGGDAGVNPLSLGEYNELARALHERKRSPSDLLGDEAAGLIAECRGGLDAERLERVALGDPARRGRVETERPGDAGAFDPEERTA